MAHMQKVLHLLSDYSPHGSKTLSKKNLLLEVSPAGRKGLTFVKVLGHDPEGFIHVPQHLLAPSEPGLYLAKQGSQYGDRPPIPKGALVDVLDVNVKAMSDIFSPYRFWAVKLMGRNELTYVDPVVLEPVLVPSARGLTGKVKRERVSRSLFRIEYQPVVATSSRRAADGAGIPLSRPPTYSSRYDDEGDEGEVSRAGLERLPSYASRYEGEELPPYDRFIYGQALVDLQ